LRNNKKPVADFGQIACNLQLSRRLQTQVNDPVVSATSFLQAAPRLEDSVPVVQSILADSARRLLGLERLDLARALSDLALSENKLDADALSVAAHILDRQGEWKKSLAQLWEAHTLSPEAPQGRLNLAMALLRFGDYREGFALYEARVDKKNWSGFATPESRAALRHLKLRPDQLVEGKRILILAEQGLGDGIMFARYIAMLVKRGARVAIACNTTMRPFFVRIAGIETVLSPPSDKPFAQINLAALPFDAWTPLLSLAAWFETDVANVPAEIPYWTPDQNRVVKWRDRFAAMGRFEAPRVGLVFQANPDGASFVEKSMTVDDVMPLLSLEGIDFVNLQHGPAGRALAEAAPRMINPFAAQVPLDEYAAAIAATDLVISVDTMAAHCAGAMGQATWLAVPHSPHWAWGLDGSTTPWYPSIAIFRQSKRRDWSGAIEMLTTELSKKFAQA
jgi:tetratricopeptide (TPR) repeat protein